MIIINAIKRYWERKKLLKECEKVTLKGKLPEMIGESHFVLKRGSIKGDILLGEDVGFFNGCQILSTCHGKITIGDHVRFQRNVRLQCVEKIVIGDYTAIASNVCITDNNSHPVNPEFRRFMRTTPHRSNARSWTHAAHQPVIIGHNCWIGENSRIQKGVTIGDNSIIAACSVVTKDVPTNCIAAGNPARIVKTDIDKIPAPTSCKEFNEYIANKNK